MREDATVKHFKHVTPMRVQCHVTGSSCRCVVLNACGVRVLLCSQIWSHTYKDIYTADP